MIVYMSHSVYEIDFTDQLNLLDSASFIYKVADRLAEKKRACWIAGGAVRDLWLGRTPQDIDLVTDALDGEILELFPKAVLVGQKFGVYKLPFTIDDRNIIIDLTVFREEDEYVDGRRPQSIKRSTPLADACRRDFTINAIFYDLQNHEVIDYVNGVQDLQVKILRCVGDADRRFREDHLRLLRLARFKAQLGFEVSPNDLEVALRLADLICSVSGERIYEEVVKVIKTHREYDFWSQNLTQKLWCALGAKIDHLQFDKLKFIAQTNFLPQQKFILNVVLLWNYLPESVNFLKDRLKCSKDEMILAKKTIEYFLEIKKAISVLDMALRLDGERDRGLVLQVLDLFVQVGECSSEYVQSIKQILDMNSAVLLSGGDLIGQCEPSQIQGLLRLIRRAQFEKKIKTSEEAFIFLKEQNLI